MMRDYLISFSMKHECNELFFVIRDLNVLRELKNLNY